MAQISEDCLLQAIKKDDVKAFRALMETAQCGVYRLGRFPVLSLFYLYRARKLLSVYEEKFLKITGYEPLREPVELSKKFSAIAGKCLRLYLSETVSPTEMLLLLDKTRRLKRVFPVAKPSAEIKRRLVSIYAIRYSLEVKFEGEGIVLERRPLSYREKRNISVICLCSVFAVAVTIGVPVLIPKPVEGEVTRLSQIDFASEKEYTLKQDIVLPENYSVEAVNCTISGEGHKLVFGKGATLGELNGKISDMTLESAGTAIFTTVSETASIENVTVNVTASVSSAEPTALVALTNYGTIDGVTLNVSGTVGALAASETVSSEMTFGGIVLNNSFKVYLAENTVYRGIVRNCIVNYSQLTLIGETSANAAFGGIAGVNNGYVLDCTVTGEIVADTFDIAGVCSTNNYLLSGNKNAANLSQTSSDKDWNPIVCGIVITNAYAVENCENSGNLSSVSECGEFEVQEGSEPAASAAGIAYLNRSSTTTPYLLGCTNQGKIACSAAYRSVYAAGVCISSSGAIEGCANRGGVTGGSEHGATYVGGIASLAYGNIVKSWNAGAVTAEGGGAAYLGGIAALASVTLSNCKSSGDITAKAQTVCAGGIFGFSDVVVYGRVYCGSADSCISEATLYITASDGENSYVGGIAGCLREARAENGDSLVFFEGSVKNCYFMGELVAELPRFGNIVGLCGIGVFEDSGDTDFSGNYYLENSFGAFGAAVTEDGDFVTIENKGATVATPEEMQNTEVYKTIQSALEGLFDE